MTTTGLAHDREFVVVRLEAGRATALTQRKTPQLALIAPDLPSAEGLTLHKAGMRSVSVEVTSSGTTYDIDCPGVWDDSAQGVDQGDRAAAWLDDALGEQGLRLARFTGRRPTPLPEKYGDGRTRFSDGFSMLLTSEASLDDLAARTGLGRFCERMRPNVVVDGCAAFEEDTWRSLWWRRGGAEARLLLPKPCARCTIPRVDPATGVPGPDPVAKMKAYRSGRALEAQALPHGDHYQSHRGEIFFGQNVNVACSGEVVLRVGDAVVPA